MFYYINRDCEIHTLKAKSLDAAKKEVDKTSPAAMDQDDYIMLHECNAKRDTWCGTRDTGTWIA